MKLQFDTYKKNQYYCVNIWYQTSDNCARETGREYLTEEQYSKISDWCKNTFNTSESKFRARRMSYADFWFASARDLDWFILHWSSIDGDDV